MDILVSNLNTGSKLPIGVEAWRLIQTRELELIQIHLKPNETISQHRNPQDVIFYVLEGEGELTIESNSYCMNKGDCIFVGNEKVRGWINWSDAELKLLIVKKRLEEVMNEFKK
jgi:quercetin dioxygenase-like cupin family protein